MNDEVEMHTVEERIPTLEGRTMFRWPRFLLESVLAIGGSLAVTGLIGLFHLYPTIPNISLVYLLVILCVGEYPWALCCRSCIGDCFSRLRLFPCAAFLYLCHRTLGGMDCFVRLLSDCASDQSAYSCHAPAHRSSTATGTRDKDSL